MWGFGIPELSFIVGCCLLPSGFVIFAVLLWQFETNEKKKRRKSHELSDSFIMPITEEADKIRRTLKQAEKVYEEVDEYPSPDLFLQIATGSNAWKKELDQVVKTKTAQRRRIRYWGLFILLMGLYWPWIGVVYWLMLPFGKYAALSFGFFAAGCLFVVLFSFVNSLLTPSPYKPGWIWLASPLIGFMIGWILVYFSNDKSLSTGVFLATEQLKTLYYGVIYVAGAVGGLLIFVDGRKHAPWYGRSLPEDLYNYALLGILVGGFLLIFSPLMFERPIITEPGVFEWGFVVSMIKVFSLQGIAFGLFFGEFVLNMNGFNPESDISISKR